MSSQPDLDDRIRRFYAEHSAEVERLAGRSAAGQVELTRVRQALDREIAAGSTVLDVGGGTGVHARYLAGAGCTVTLVDPVPEHVAAAAADGGFAAERGDARALRHGDASMDAVLLLGPLYHLRSRADRLLALTEAHRVLRPGGRLLAAGISRSIALLDAVIGVDPADLPVEALVAVLRPGAGLEAERGFPAGHFHTAAELRAELEQAGFQDVTVTGLEGPGSLALELVRPTDDVVAAGLVLAERAQDHPLSADLSGHLLAVGRTPSPGRRR
ncbi:MAG TPA: class I SAM-dependent methyltransferase [Cellulomonas sp.]